MNEIINKVDEHFLRQSVSFPYQSIVILDKNVAALSVVMESLEEGPVSVVFEYGNKYNLIKKKISNSALTLEKLLRVYNFRVFVSPGRSYDVKTTRDILEIGDWML